MKKIEYCYPTNEIPDLQRDPNYYHSYGVPIGQKDNFRRAFSDGSGTHARVYEGYTCFHSEKMDLKMDLPGHLTEDAPDVLLPVLFGAVLGSLVAGSKGSVVGGLAGFVFASERLRKNTIKVYRRRLNQ